jgi:hypothetical protein
MSGRLSRYAAVESEKWLSRSLPKRALLMRILVLSMAGVLLTCQAATAQAGDMRCGNDIVDIGQSAFMVTQKCGDPNA